MGKKADAVREQLHEAQQMVEFWRNKVEEVSYILGMPGSPDLTTVPDAVRKTVAEKKRLEEQNNHLRNMLKSSGWVETASGVWIGKVRYESK